jgi:hypothetical protein
MFAPLTIQLLVACLFIILAGWAIDEIRTGGRDLEAVSPMDPNRMGDSGASHWRDRYIKFDGRGSAAKSITPAAQPPPHVIVARRTWRE